MEKSVFQKIDEFFESEKGKASIEKYRIKMKRKEEILSSRLSKLKIYLEHNSFDSLMERMRVENGDDYQDKCYNKGYMPHPTNILNLILEFIEVNGEVVDYNIGGGDFLASEIEFNGYLFQLYHGQGSFSRVHKKIDNEWEFYFQI